MYFSKPPYLLRKTFGKLICNIPSVEKTLYLTFDDGPTPDVTSGVLDILLQFNAKATFFCVGKNVEQYPEIYCRIIEEGHTAGNHTFNHLDGWKTKTSVYLNDIEKCASLIKSPLFRPPFGRLLPAQYRSISKKYRIIIWDVLSGDFDNKCSRKDCLKNVFSKIKNGSIVVLHDNYKARSNMFYVLPKVLENFSQLGYAFNLID